MSLARVLLGPCLALCLLAVPLAGQQPRPQAADSARARPDTVTEADLVFEREVFEYPTFQRRNPFEPLVGNLAGPRYEEIILRGIIFTDDPRSSVALLGLRQRAQQQVQRQAQQQERAQQQGTAVVDTIVVEETSTRLRVGESWGNVRVVQILRDHVIVAVNEFGQTEQRILRMPTRRIGGL